MNRFLKNFVFLSSLVAFSLPVFAQDLKVGIVDPNKLLEDAPQARIALAKLEKEFAARDKQLRQEQIAIKKLEERLSRDGAIMSDAERRKIERDVISRKRDLRRSLDELREDRTFRSNEERNKLLRYLNDAIAAVGKEESFDLILYEGIAFADPKIDLTQKILQRLKAEASNKK
ncbi:MAG: OmpH family outer membrane protein [Granulosicoccaceae bacterium]